MLLLFETPAGYALFRVKKEKTLEKVEDFGPYMEDANIKKLVELSAFREFKGTKDVLEAALKLLVTSKYIQFFYVPIQVAPQAQPSVICPP